MNRTTLIHMKNSVYLALGCLCGLAGANSAYAQTLRQTDEPPNIILILTDDQGYGDIERHGHPFLKTPNFNKLHDESARFVDFQVATCCSPTRAGLMSGFHGFKVGVTNTTRPFFYMDTDVSILPRILKRAGYRTGMFGKWHLGMGKGHHPEDRGFDSVLTSHNDDKTDFFDPVLERNRVKEKHTGYRTDILFREAMKFIESPSEKPFFVYLPTYSPHFPLKVPKKYAQPYGDKRFADFFGMIANIDENIGRLLRHLNRLNLSANTLIICMNDNGGTFGIDTYNANMRGGKGAPWSGGARAFSFWRWPETIAPGDISAHSTYLDVLPTLSEIAGAKDTVNGDGKSLLPLLKGGQKDWAQPRWVFSNTNRWGTPKDCDTKEHLMASVRWGDYHLVANYPCSNSKCRYLKCRILRTNTIQYSPEKAGFHYGPTPAKEWMLYDIKADPEEKNPITTKPEIVEKMKARYWQWWAEVRPLMHRHPF